MYRLAVHLKDEQYVYFKHSSEAEMIDNNLGTTITEWFELNNIDFNPKHYLYNEIPNHYVFDKNLDMESEKKIFGNLFQVECILSVLKI